MQTLMEGVDIVYHLACLGVRHSIHSPFENHQVNAEGSLIVFQSATNTTAMGWTRQLCEFITTLVRVPITKLILKINS